MSQPPHLHIAFANSIQMFAGGEIWMLTTMRALRERGHQVLLVCRPGTQLETRARLEGLDVRPIRFRGDFDPVTILTLAKVFKTAATQVVLTNMDKELRLCGIAARIAGVPAVIPRRGIDYPLKNSWRYRFAYNVLATKIIANSAATKTALLRNAPWLSAQRVEVVYNGIDPSSFEVHTNGRVRDELGLPRDAPVIGFVGQLDERKGIDDLLQAFVKVHRRLPDAHLVLAGTGKLESAVRDFSRRNGLGAVTHLLGFRDDISAVMRSIDVLVLPSRWEGFGMVLIEAMAAARPVVATRASSIPEIVDDGKTGYLVPPGAPEHLAERLVEVLTNRQLAADMGRHGRARVAAQFTIDRMVDRLERIFIETLQRWQGRSL